MGRYPIELYDRYFISWGEACAAARTTGMSDLPPQRRQAAEGQFTLELDG
jgi:site-specific DNA-methyltransferase (adenine-specific)